MTLYHASPVPGITVLRPRISPGHQTSAGVWLSAKRENVLVYLVNAVEKCCREAGFAHEGAYTMFGPYGFDRNGILCLTEYYPDAMRDTYAGQRGYIYLTGSEGAAPAENGIRDAFVSREPVPVISCETVPDTWEAIRQAEAQGLLRIARFESWTEAQLAHHRKTLRQEAADPDAGADYRYFLNTKCAWAME